MRNITKVNVQKNNSGKGCCTTSNVAQCCTKSTKLAVGCHD